MNKTYYLCGYYGMRNSGDDALLLSTMLGAKHYLSASKFLINTPTQLSLPELGAFKPNLISQQRFKGENRIRQCLSAWRADGVIFGGGSVFHCYRDIQVKRLMMKLSGKGPHLALGVGLGPFANTKAEKECAKFLMECSYTGLRDKHSYNVAKAIAPGANFGLTFDLAPALSPKIEQQFKENAWGVDLRRGVGVALCPRESLQGDNESESHRIQKIADALTKIYRNSGEPIFLIDFNGHETLGDTLVHDQLHQYMPSNVPVFHVPYDPNPLRLMMRLAKLKMVVSMRLHGSILSYMTNTPVISINYHSKCDGWCDQVGMPANYRFDADDIDASELANTAIEGLWKGFDDCQLPRKEAYERALSNFLGANLSAV